ncbi:MAG: hypothetical protein AAF403_08930, partial [Pseudomonadota bacterium]
MHYYASFNALLPVFAVIALGFLFKRFVHDHRDHWRAMERISYLCLIPVLIIRVLDDADLSTLKFFDISFALGTSLTLIFLMTMALYPLLTRPNFIFKVACSKASYTSIFQTSTRWHAFIAIAVASEIYDIFALQIIALAMVVMIPLINVVNVAMMYICLRKGKLKFGVLLKNIALNPMMIGIFVGIFLAFSQIELWQPIRQTIDIIADTTLGIALICIGVGLRLNISNLLTPYVICALLLKLIIFPAVTLMVAISMDIKAIELICLAIITSVP